MSESKTMRRVPRMLPLLRRTLDSTGGLKSFSLHERTSWFNLLRERPVCGHLVPPLGRRTNSGFSLSGAEVASIGAWI
jgi:hypothetical protein